MEFNIDINLRSYRLIIVFIIFIIKELIRLLIWKFLFNVVRIWKDKFKINFDWVRGLGRVIVFKLIIDKVSS